MKISFFSIVYTALLSTAALIFALILIGTITAMVRPDNSKPILKIGGTQGRIKGADQTDDIRVFSGLGRLRITLSNSSVLLLSIAFPYSASDVTFSEELAAKIGDLKAIATGYFSALPEESIIHIDEETAKQEIIRRFNSNLRLGRIEALYFSDMLVIDADL